MSNLPIQFHADMIRSILNGHKTQTRRILKIDGIDGGLYPVFPPEEIVQFCDGTFHYLSTAALSGPYPCKYGSPGDRLWVQEAWRYGDGGSVIYLADEEWNTGAGWKKPESMDFLDCRIRLEITNVRAELLQDISGEDADAEGMLSLDGMIEHEIIRTSMMYRMPVDDVRTWFAAFWEILHGENSWKENPWVWVISFKVLETKT